ncbi:MAG: endonuclease III [Candidatus Obscuribacterales bacterium]|nr:endonuclease III [Candidatus Obscuribacterales bacterium]
MQKKATQSRVNKPGPVSKPAAKPTKKVPPKPTAKPAAKPAAKPSVKAKASIAPKSNAAKGKSASPAGTYKKAGKGKPFGTVTLVQRDDADHMMKILCKRYPDAECELTHKNDFELLTSVILSAQTTDAQVNKVTPSLFARFSTPKALAEADIEEVKQIVRPTGYYNAKAKSIQDCAIGIVTKFGGKIPKTLEELITLPGVGRKTANVVLGVLHGESAWTVDTHVQRLSHRLGFTTEEDPYKIELALQKLFPNDDWSKFSITLIWHGRRTCFAKNPNCAECPINHLCPSSSV